MEDLAPQDRDSAEAGGLGVCFFFSCFVVFYIMVFTYTVLGLLYFSSFLLGSSMVFALICYTFGLTQRPFWKLFGFRSSLAV